MKKKLLVFKLFGLLLIGLTMFSCVPQKKMKYLQDKEGDTAQYEFQALKPDYQVKPGDYLYIRVFSLDQKSNELFATIGGSAAANYNMNITDQNLYLTSYWVNDSGYIDVPLFGRIEAGGRTINDIQQILNGKVSEIIIGASVVVKLVMYNVSLLGEVNAPGKYSIYNNRVNIFEALAMAHDLTAYADRSKVQIIRTEGNKTNVVVFNLLNKDILSSPYYYLRPNDIIYVEPLKEKSYAYETFPYALVLSSVSLLLVVLTFFK
jgi:polysaccharide export outer membrane protein